MIVAAAFGALAVLFEERAAVALTVDCHQRASLSDVLQRGGLRRDRAHARVVPHW